MLGVMLCVLAGHRDHLQTFAEADRPYIYYVDLRHVPDDERADMRATLQFTLASTSRQRVLELCTAQDTGIPGLLWLDIRSMLWNGNQVTRVFQRYPYNRRVQIRHDLFAVPRVWRADWLILELWDTTRSDARYRLLHNDAGIDRDKWLAFHGDRKERDFAIGFIEGASGVTISGKRVLISDERRDWIWTTLDFVDVDEQDPLEQPDNAIADWQDAAKAIHDGSEHIASLHKHSLKSGKRGILQDYFLSNAKGQRVEEGPTNLVQDRTRSFRGLAEIRLGACVTCHVAGLNFPTSDEYRLFRGDRYVKRDKQLELAAFYAPVLEKLKHTNEQYTAGVELVTGMTPEQNVAAFTGSVAWYDNDVDIDQAGRELDLPAEEVGLAIAYASKNIDVGARLSHLSEGGRIPRSSFESNFRRLLEVVELWNTSKK